MLTRASLRYYAATNALVVLGVAVAVAVLAGALLVGASVRESLRQLALGRLGNTNAVVSSPTFFRTALADDLIARNPALNTAPLIVAGGAVSHEESKRAAGRVMVYGINERFGEFQGTQIALSNRETAISEALATELGAKVGDSVTLRVAKPTDIPLSSLQGRKEETGERIRLTIARILDRASMGEFSLAPSQGEVLSLFAPLPLLQRDLSLGDRVNTILLSGNGAGERLPISLDDLALRTRTGPSGVTIIESRAGLITDALVSEIERAVKDAQPVLTYVANAIRIRDREIPYSTVTAIDQSAISNRQSAILRCLASTSTSRSARRSATTATSIEACSSPA